MDSVYGQADTGGALLLLLLIMLRHLRLGVCAPTFIVKLELVVAVEANCAPAFFVSVAGRLLRRFLWSCSCSCY